MNLFKRRRPPSNAGVFNDMFPPAVTEDFPHDLDRALGWSMAPERLAAIRADIEELSGKFIKICVPWRIDAIPPASIVWFVSHAVLEHVDEVDETYSCFDRWVRPHGVMSHLIDFFSHGLTREWNSHRSVWDLAWAFTRGKRHWLINRLPLSMHLALIEKHGFQVAKSVLCPGPKGTDPSKFARRFRNIPQIDTRTRMALLICSHN